MRSSDEIRVEGRTLERRAVLTAPFAVAAATLLARSANAQKSAAASATSVQRKDSFDFDAFVAQCGALAAELLRAKSKNHDAFLHQVGSLGARLDLASVPRGELGAFGALDPSVHFGPIHRAPPLVVIQWRLAPHAVLPPHCHQPAEILSLCLEGECRVRHYEIRGDAPAPGAAGEFEVRETVSALLVPGRSSSVSPTRDNIHTFEASAQGALGIDINTLLPTPGDWSFLRLSAAAKDATHDTFAARWIGQEPAK